MTTYKEPRRNILAEKLRQLIENKKNNSDSFRNLGSGWCFIVTLNEAQFLMHDSKEIDTLARNINNIGLSFLKSKKEKGIYKIKPQNRFFHNKKELIKQFEKILDDDPLKNQIKNDTRPTKRPRIESPGLTNPLLKPGFFTPFIPTIQKISPNSVIDFSDCPSDDEYNEHKYSPITLNDDGNDEKVMGSAIL